MEKDNPINLILKCNVENVSSFVHSIIDGVCGNKGPKYVGYSQQWTLEEWWDVTEAYTQLVTHFVNNNQSKDELERLLSEVSTDYKSAIIDALCIRRDDIKQALKDATIQLSNTHLRDFDWQLKLVLASDKCASINEPLVNLDLDITSSRGDRMVSVELGQDDLKSMIKSLEAANKHVMQLKS